MINMGLFIQAKYNYNFPLSEIIGGLSGIFKDNHSSITKELKRYFGSDNYYFMDSGRSCLDTILKALNLPDGSEVMIPVNVCKVVTHTVKLNNLKPVLIDITNNLCIDPADIERKITDKTKIVIPVHLFGNVCDMDSILTLAEKHNLKIIEDCAHTISARYKGKGVGNFGIASFNSLDFTKQFSVYNGGILICNDKKLDDRIKQIEVKKESLFQDLKRIIGILSFKFFSNKIIYSLFTRFLINQIKESFFAPPKRRSMGNIGKALLLKQLYKLEAIDRKRIEAATEYCELLYNSGIEIFRDESEIYLTYLSLPVGVPDKTGLTSKLYDTIVDLPAASPLLETKGFPGAAKIYQKMILLPTFVKKPLLNDIVKEICKYNSGQ